MTALDQDRHIAASPIWPLTVVLAILAMLTPTVDATLMPVRTHQRITNIERTPTRLCWDWISVKEQNRISDGIEVYLTTETDRFVVSIFEKATGMPWARSRAVGLGPHVQPYCVALPPSVRPTDHLKVEQTAWYPGWIGLYRVPVRLPDVVSVGAPS